MKATRYPNLDWLRLFLAVSVPFYHAWNQSGAKFDGLFFAVPGFLVLSGIVVPQSFELSRNWAHFAWKRILRVMPAFVVSFGLIAALYGARSLLPTFEYYASLGLWTPSRDSRNGVLWSLSCEEVIYVMLAILFLLGVYKKRWAIWTLFFASGAATWALLGTAQPPTHVRALVLPSAFFMGNLFYLYRDRFSTRSWWPVAAILAATCLSFFRGPSLQVQFVVQTLLIGAVAWFGIAGPTIRLKLPMDASYGLYIYHLPILALLLAAGVQGRFELISLTIGAAFTMASVSWFVIEKPALSLKNVSRCRRPLAEVAAVPSGSQG